EGAPVEVAAAAVLPAADPPCPAAAETALVPHPATTTERAAMASSRIRMPCRRRNRRRGYASAHLREFQHDLRREQLRRAQRLGERHVAEREFKREVVDARRLGVFGDPGAGAGRVAGVAVARGGRLERA